MMVEGEGEFAGQRRRAELLSALDRQWLRFAIIRPTTLIDAHLILARRESHWHISACVRGFNGRDAFRADPVYTPQATIELAVTKHPCSIAEYEYRVRVSGGGRPRDEGQM